MTREYGNGAKYRTLRDLAIPDRDCKFRCRVNQITREYGNGAKYRTLRDCALGGKILRWDKTLLGRYHAGAKDVKALCTLIWMLYHQKHGLA